MIDELELVVEVTDWTIENVTGTSMNSAVSNAIRRSRVTADGRRSRRRREDGGYGAVSPPPAALRWTRRGALVGDVTAASFRDDSNPGINER